ncbi:hypothetical protein DXG01_017145 [Tephrocybe rancida]|nr:hypothetical protein DXG01_017145 [Tephrocybe rancida]
MTEAIWSVRPNILPRTFERLLGRNELGFYWDSQFNGTADTLQTAIIEKLDLLDQDLFGVENISKAWGTLKRQFPLLGSRLEVQGGERVSFVVAEDRLEHSGPGEISFETVTTLAEAHAYVDEVVNGKRPLSDNLLARIVVLARTDQLNQVHVLIHVAHLITDGVGNTTILRSFLDILSSPPSKKQWDIEQRLSLAIPPDVLAPGNKAAQNRARLRWHRSIGHALPVLAQVALARVLCRRYIHGGMSEEEWNYRRREPTLTGGPINLRPFLDRQWYQEGGSTNVSLVIGFFHYKLPFIPLGSAANLAVGDDLPSFQQLLSLPRFLHRSRIIGKQAKHQFEHPLFTYIAGTRTTASIAKFKEVGQSWKEKQNSPAAEIPVVEQSPVFAHGGSSMGDTSGVKLHCRPAELYLGASTVQQKLHLSVFWDKNVYDENLVTEWLNEVREAAYVFLGGGVMSQVQARL